MRFYFVRGKGRWGKRAHIAESGSRDDILFKGNYRTLCGATLAPKRWGLETTIEYHQICGKCRGILEKESNT